MCLVALVASSANSQQSIEAKRFSVTSGHPAATAAGLAVLRAGGNVVDAAITTSLCLGVAEPYGSGLGGKGMLLYRDGTSGRLFAIEAMCAAPMALDAEQFAIRPRRERYYGYTSAGVPGLLAALDAVHRRWGSMNWRDIVTPAVELAAGGVMVSEEMYKLMRPKRNLLRRDAEAASVYLVNGETPSVGSVMKYPDLARSLRLIADHGPLVFYKGELGEQIVAGARAAGAPLAMADFRAYSPTIGPPLSAAYDEFLVHTSPQPLTGGATVLATLRALDGVAALDATSGRDPKFINITGRILLSVYPRVNRAIADVPTASAAAEAILTDESISQIRQEAEAAEPEIFGTEAAKSRRHEAMADEMAEASTSHLIVADAEGNIVCLTQSLSLHFGACVVPPGTGILLNNSMSNYSIDDPTGCNYVAPGKRERSTIAPIIVTRDKAPVLALGIPGGQRIPTTTVQLLTDVLHFGTPLKDAIGRPRFHVRRPLTNSESGNVVDLEDDAPADFDQELSARGWQPVRQRRDGTYFGGGSAVMYRRDGSLEGVADLRRTNTADGQ